MPYADLILYFGFCNSDIRGEGRFDYNAKDEWSARRRIAAVQNVQRYLEPGWEFGLHVVENYLVGSELEAKTLIDFAEKNIPHSHGIINLVDLCHGSIRFFRKIRFDGAVESQREELIEKMKKSGYIPKDRERELLIRNLGALYKGEQLEQVLLKEGLVPDRMWSTSLKFFN